MTLKFLSWNVDDDRRVDLDHNALGEEHAAYALAKQHTIAAFGPTFSMENRIDNIFNYLNYAQQEKEVKIFCLQEIQDSSVHLFEDKFKKMGLECIVNKYNPKAPGSFNYITAYDPNSHEAKEQDQIYLTTTGKPVEGKDKDQNLSTDFSKSSQHVQFTHKETGEKVHIFNNHFGIPNEHKLLAADMLCQRIKELNLEKVILAGDFNQFDSSKKEAKLFMPQIKIFQDDGYTWESKDLKKTFAIYPYDNRFLTKEQFNILDKIKTRDPEEAASDLREFYMSAFYQLGPDEIISTALDAVFTKGLCSSTVQTLILENGSEITPSKEELSQKITDYYRNGKIFSPSDHFPILSDIDFLGSSTDFPE